MNIGCNSNLDDLITRVLIEIVFMLISIVMGKCFPMIQYFTVFLRILPEEYLLNSSVAYTLYTSVSDDTEYFFESLHTLKYVGIKLDKLRSSSNL